MTHVESTQLQQARESAHGALAPSIVPLAGLSLIGADGDRCG